MSVFFTSRKTAFKSLLNTSSIPLQYLAVYRVSSAFFLSQSRQLLDTWWIDQESSCLLDSFWTPSGLIELLFLYLMICSSTPPRYLYLSKTIFTIPPSTDVSTPLDTFICRGLLRHYLFFLVRFEPHFVRSLSIDLCFLSQTISSHSNLCSSRFLQAFSSFSFLDKLLIFSYSCISCFET